MARGQDSGNLSFFEKKKKSAPIQASCKELFARYMKNVLYALNHNLQMFSPVPRKDTKKRKHFPTLLSRRVFPKHNKSMAYGWVSAWISMGLGHNLNTYGTDQWCHSRAYCWHHTTMKVARRCNPSPHWGPSLYSCHCNLTKTKKEKYCIDLNIVKKNSLVFPSMWFMKFMSSCRAILDKHAAFISDHGVSYWNSWCFEGHQQFLQLLCFFTYRFEGISYSCPSRSRTWAPNPCRSPLTSYPV